MESFAGAFLYGSELYSFASNAVTGNGYDVMSAANMGLVNEFVSAAGRFAYEFRKDTSDMDEKEEEKHTKKLCKLALAVVEAGMQAAGVPFGNGKKLLEAAGGWIQTVKNWGESGKRWNFDSLPKSATGQYDRLYNAYASGDPVEAQAAVEKLIAMGKEDKIYSELKKRLKQYDPDVLEAAKAQNSGNTERREELTQKIVQNVYKVMGIDPKAKADAAKREAVIDMVTGDGSKKGAINALADELLATESGHDKDAGIYADLTMAAEKGSAKELQEELDRLLRAGKSLGSVKSKITAVCKPEYVAGSEYDRTQLDEMLLALRDADNNPLYTQKTLDSWVSDAEKKSAEPVNDPWADLR